MYHKLVRLIIPLRCKDYLQNIKIIKCKNNEKTNPSIDMTIFFSKNIIMMKHS